MVVTFSNVGWRSRADRLAERPRLAGRLATAVRPRTITGSMAAKLKRRAALPREVPADLEAIVREALAVSPGVKSTQLKKVLTAPCQPFAKEALELARRLTAAGQVHVWRKGKTELFFPAEPLAELDKALLGRAWPGALSKDALTELASSEAPGYEVVVDAWLKRAIASKRLYEHAPTVGGTRKKRYAVEPDVRKSLGPVLSALRKALVKTATMGISNERVAEVLLAELEGLPLPAASRPVAGDGAWSGAARQQFLAALSDLVAEHPNQALLAVRDLRARLSLGKQQFDELALSLLSEGVITLHHHDHPASVPALERSQWVQDARGTHYLGIAPRRGP